MIKAIISFLSNILSTKKAAETTIEIARKITGLEHLTEDQKSNFLIKYMESTKYQSPVRRLLAIGAFTVWAWFLFWWFVYVSIGNIFDVTGAITAAGLLFAMIKEISPYIGGLWVFYFAVSTITAKGAK